MSNTKKAFTLIEVLTVISIIGLLSSIVFGNLATAREKGRIAAGQTAQQSIHGAYGADAVAYFDFDDSTATTIRDSLGNGYNITMPAGCTLVDDSPSSSGKSLNCSAPVSFAPKDEYDRSATDEGKSFSFALWVKPTAATPYPAGVIMSRSNTVSNYTTGVYLAPDATISGTYYTAGFNVVTSLGNKIAQNKWSFVVFSIDSVGNRARVYVDGKQVSSVALSASNLYTYALAHQYRFGLSGFAARYDKVGFYRRALGLAEIEHMYAIQGSPLLANNSTE